MKKLLFTSASFNIDAAINEALHDFSTEAGYTVSSKVEVIKKQKTNQGLKAVWALVVGLCIAVASSAQTSFGVKAGLNRYALTGEDQSYITSFHVGGLVQIAISRQFIFQPELLISKEGNAFEENNIKIGTYLNYLSIPLLAKWQTKGGVYGEAGPGFALLMNAKFKETDLPDEDIKSFFKGSNFFVALGAGYQSKMGLGIGIRYNLGMANIAAKGLDEMKTTGGHISVFYVLKSKKK
jgi:hypothetical protein